MAKRLTTISAIAICTVMFGTSAPVRAEPRVPSGTVATSATGSNAAGPSELTDVSGPAPATGAAVPDRPGPSSQSPALDLCALKPDATATRYQAQRVLLLNPSIDPGVNAAEEETNESGVVIDHPTTLRAVNAAEMVRLIVAGQFPMQRLYTVYSPAVVEASLFDRKQIAAADLALVTGGDAFASYSLGCAEWIAAPRVARTGATWKKTKRKKTVIDQNGKSQKVEYWAWDFSVTFRLELSLFKRDGQDFKFYRVVDNSGLGGLFASGSVAEPRTLPFHAYVSTWPDSACPIGAPHDGQAGNISTCGSVEPKLSAELDAGALSSGSYCSNVDDAVGAPMAKIAACAVASSAESAVKVLQLHAKQDPWGMFAELLENNTMALGAREGAKRGDYYTATPPGALEPSGFARIRELGAGGEEAARSPSQIKFKAGEAPVGSRLTEFPMLGAQFGARPGVMLLLSKGKLDTGVGFGGTVTVAYDATSYIPVFDEFWLRANLGLFAGAAKEKFVLVDVGPEGTTYLGGGLAGVVGVGFSALVANRDVEMAGASTTFSGASTGALLRGSLEYAFSPAWNTSFSAEVRTGFKSTMLTAEKLPGLAVDAGPLLGGLAFLSVGHTL